MGFFQPLAEALGTFRIPTPRCCSLRFTKASGICLKVDPAHGLIGHLVLGGVHDGGVRDGFVARFAKSGHLANSRNTSSKQFSLTAQCSRFRPFASTTSRTCSGLAASTQSMQSPARPWATASKASWPLCWVSRLPTECIHVVQSVCNGRFYNCKLT